MTLPTCSLLEISALVPWVAGAWGVGGSIVGLALGHWLSLGRDRRKEWNEVADRIRLSLTAQIGKVTPYSKWPSSDDIALLIAMSSSKKGRRLRRLADEHEDSRRQHTEQDSYGQSSYTRIDHIDAAIKNLLAEVGRRR